MSYEQYKAPAGVSLLNNYTATSAPTANDDSGDGYSVGSVWIDTTADERYVCLDNTLTSAVWAKTTAGTATEIVFTPAGNLASATVQLALEELDTEKQAKPSEGAFVNGDKTKLDGIEAGADVTDATNVDSAGATMNSDTNVSGNSWVLDEDNMASDSATKVPTQQSVKAYVDGKGATSGEVDTGTSTAKFVTPDALAGSVIGKKSVQFVVFDFATNVATGDGKFYFRVPTALGGMNLVNVGAKVITAGTTNTTDIQIHNLTQTADMLSTKMTIDSGETDTSTAVTAPVIDTNNDDVASGDILRVDVDAVSTTPPQGLIISLEFQLP